MAGKTATQKVLKRVKKLATTRVLKLVAKKRQRIMSEELLPCPNCKVGSGFISKYTPTLERVRMECNCGVSGPYAATRAGAVEGWNNLPRRSVRKLDKIKTNEVWHTTYYDQDADWIVGDRVYYTEEGGMPIYLKNHPQSPPIGIVVITPTEDAPLLGFVLYPGASVPKATLQEYNQ
jgi:hypothetical protein